MYHSNSSWHCFYVSKLGLWSPEAKMQLMGVSFHECHYVLLYFGAICLCWSHIPYNYAYIYIAWWKLLTAPTFKEPTDSTKLEDYHCASCLHTSVPENKRRWQMKCSIKHNMFLSKEALHQRYNYMTLCIAGEIFQA